MRNLPKVIDFNALNQLYLDNKNILFLDIMSQSNTSGRIKIDNLYYFQDIDSKQYYCVKADGKEMDLFLNEKKEKKINTSTLHKRIHDSKSNFSLSDLMTVFNYTNNVLPNKNMYQTKICRVKGEIKVGQSNANVNELEEIYRNVKALEDVIYEKENRSEIEIINLIHSYYYECTSYWDPITFGYSVPWVGCLDINRDKCSHAGDYAGLLGNEHYATCAGIAEGLNELFNYFNINSRLVATTLHEYNVVTLKNGEEHKIDLAFEISPTFKDTKYYRANGVLLKRDKPLEKSQINLIKEKNHIIINGIHR